MSQARFNDSVIQRHDDEVVQSPYKNLADQIYRERVFRARQMSASEKIMAGPRLFESACNITLAGIRNQFPGLTEERYLEILRERLALRRWRQQRQFESDLT